MRHGNPHSDADPYCYGQSDATASADATTSSNTFAVRDNPQGGQSGWQGSASHCPACVHYWVSDPGYDLPVFYVSAFGAFISLIFRCKVRRLMPSFLAAAVTLPFVAARAWAINFL